MENPPNLSNTDFDLRIESRKAYMKEKKKWQLRMKQVQLAYFHQNLKALIVFEGWDAGGKGGAIRNLTEKLDPRGFLVHPISAPTKEEQGRHYMYRFNMRIPSPGTLSIFDRSYYGRVLVERVEGFAKQHEWERAYKEINDWESMLMDDGVRIIKLFMHISPEEQLKRFAERISNPMKRWKLTEEDIRNREKWQDYELAINDMFKQNSTIRAPWNVISGNHKWHARIDTLQTVVTALEQGVDTRLPELDESILIQAKEKLGISI